MSRDVMRALTEARPPELDPDAPVHAATRAAELAAIPATTSGDTTRRLIPARRRVRPVWGGGLGLVGAAAAAALALTSTGGGQGGAVPGPPEQPDARAVLLAAAEKAETAPATGKYWRVTQMYLIPVRVGPKARPYTVVDARVDEVWLARSGGTWHGFQMAGAKPKTSQDEEAWRLDGSPARWDRGIADSPEGQRLYLHTKPRRGTLVKASPPDHLHAPIAGIKPSIAALRKLPSDPAALRKLAERRALSDGERTPLRADSEQVRQAFAAAHLVDLLTTAPVPPKVRAGAFRALADMPIVTSQGKAVDGRGRAGVAFSIVTRYPGSSTRTRLIIDPATSQVLSEHVISKPEADGARGKEKVTLFLGAGWTDQAPRPPALP